MSGNGGFKHEYEMDGVYKFVKAIRIYASIKPDDAQLQEFERYARLKCIMLLTNDRMELKSWDMLNDRRNDCAECQRIRGRKPCHNEDGRPTLPCVYNSPEWKAKAIEKHFGAEGLKWMEEIGKYVEKWEAERCQE